MSEPEIIVNCWLYTDSRIIYALAVRTYMMAGSDDEMLSVLNTLAATDYKFAYHFPLPDNHILEYEGTTRRGLAFAGGHGPIYEDLSVFDAAFRQINEELTPNRTKGVKAASDWKPALDPDNLLHVKTFIEVQPNGDLVPQITIPNAPPLNPSKVSTVANLWAVADGNTGDVYAASGRPYSVQGSDSEKRNLLRKLAPHDYRLAPKHTLPSPANADEDTDIFEPVFTAMASDVPAIQIGVDARSTHKEPIDPSTIITEKQTLIEDANRQSITARQSNTAGRSKVDEHSRSARVFLLGFAVAVAAIVPFVVNSSGDYSAIAEKELVDVALRVALDGKPLSKGSVQFSGEGVPDGAGLIQDGKVVEIGHVDEKETGLRPAAYHVFFGRDQGLPEKYLDPATSGIVIEVSAHSPDFDIQLISK